MAGGLQMQKGMRKILIGSGVAAALMAVAESARFAVTEYFVNMALDRQAPSHSARSEHRLTGSCIDEKLLEKVKEAGEILSCRPQREIRIQSRDGVRLVGHWMEVPHPKRILIAMHGWRSAWYRDFGMIADFLRENGCSILFAEQRGQGGSGGTHMGFGLTERYDCLDWIEWVNAQTDKKYPVYLCGISMGASTVLMAGGLELPENVRGIVADCGYTALPAIWKHVAEKHLHMDYRLCGATACRMAKKRANLDVNSATCPQALAQCRVPVLFIHGTDDRFVPVEMTYENYKACASPKRLLVVPGAQHGMSYPTDPGGYEAAVKSFWTAFDKGISS